MIYLQENSNLGPAAGCQLLPFLFLGEGKFPY